jgi:hypothetical protein
MPKNVPAGTVMSAGAGVISPGSDSLLCQAFNEAVEAWCDPERVKNGTEFNDYFFAALENQGPEGAALAQSIAREVPILVNKTTGIVQTLEAAAETNPVAAGLAETIETFMPAGSVAAAKAWKAFRWRSLLQSWRTPGKGGSLKFPDGMADGTPIEIKGPGDTYREGQVEDYKKVSTSGNLTEISCESCGNDCNEGNKCPPPPKPEPKS